MRRLGEGGFGEVFEAENQSTSGRVALKVLRREWSTDEQAVMRLRREAQAANRVMHRNIVRILDIDQDELTTVLVMELLQGETLSSALHGWRLQLHGWVGLLVQAMRGVAAVHRQGVVHRDIKPENIFLAREEGSAELVTKVLDFGISKLESSDSRQHTLTRAGTQGLGSPRYMSPEQYTESRAVDQRTDVYAFGVVLYEALTGHTPYDAENVVSLMWKATNTEPVAPCSLCSDIPAPLSAAVLRAMAKRPEERFSSLDALIEVLEPYTRPRAFSSDTARTAPPQASLVRRIPPIVRAARTAKLGWERMAQSSSKRAGSAAQRASAWLVCSHQQLDAGVRRARLWLQALPEQPRRARIASAVVVAGALLGFVGLAATSSWHERADCLGTHAADCVERTVTTRQNAVSERADARTGEHASATSPSVAEVADEVDVRVFGAPADARLSVAGQDISDRPAVGAFALRLRPGKYTFVLTEHDREVATHEVSVSQGPPLVIHMQVPAAPSGKPDLDTPSASGALPTDAWGPAAAAHDPNAGGIPADATPAITASAPEGDGFALTPSAAEDDVPSASAAATHALKPPAPGTLASLRLAAAEHPNDADALYVLGVALRSTGDLDAALAALTRATQLPHKRFSAARMQRTLAQVLEAKGDVARAIQAMRQSLRALPKQVARKCSGEDERYLAALLVKNGELDAAIEFLRPLHAAAGSPAEAKRCKAFLKALVPSSPYATEGWSEVDTDILDNPYRSQAGPGAVPRAPNSLNPE